MRWWWDTGQPWSTKKLEAQPSFASFLPISCWTWMDSIKVRGYQNYVILNRHIPTTSRWVKYFHSFDICVKTRNSMHIILAIVCSFTDVMRLFKVLKVFKKLKHLEKFFWFLPLSDISYSSCKENTFAFQST